MNGEPTVYVVDDDQAVRDSLQWLIESIGFHVRTYETASDFLADLGNTPQRLRGCLILDVRLPGMSGLDLQDRLAEMGIAAPIIVITGHGDVPLTVRALKAGAVDFIEKPFSDQMLLDRIRDAVELDQRHGARSDQTDLIRQRMACLSPREREVMLMVVNGRLNKQIAADLGLSHKTVEVHRAHVMEKMAAGSLAELVRMAVTVEEKV